MKSVLLPFLLIFSIAQISAQDYKVVFPFRAQFFALSNQNIYPPQPSWSPVKVLYLDSSYSSTGTTDFFNFNTWKDTATMFDPTCIDANAPSWIGKQVSEMTNGYTLLYNYTGDTIYIKTDAAVNDTFNFMSLTSSGYVRAHLDSIAWMQQAGIQDSVKCYSFTAYDSSGSINPNHPLSGTGIQLSKSNGFFKTLNFRDLPDYPFDLFRIDSVPMITQADIYNFDVGDEFEYYYQCYSIFSNYPPVESFIRILGKYFSSNMDTVYYHRYWASRGFIPNPNGSPPYIQQVTVSEDTIHYYIPNTLLFTTFPEENKYTIDSNSIDMYTLRKDSSWHFGRPEYSEVNGFLGRFHPDSCIMFNHFEPSFYTYSYAPGLGLTYMESDEISQAGQDCQQRLSYYKKGNEISGTYVDLTVGIKNELGNPELSIYPNPVISYCHIDWPGTQHISSKLFDLFGRLIEAEQFDGSYTLGMENLDSGIYLLSLTSDKGNFVRKIIKK